MRWIVPRMWEGGECWVIGGGPSITEQFEIPPDIVRAVHSNELGPEAYSPYLSALHGKHVVGVNASFLLGDWLDMMFFGDHKFFLMYSRELFEWRGVKVTCHSKFSNNYQEYRIKYLAKDSKGRGISNDPSKVCWNANSGAAAINLAVHTGVKRIILLGFDMTIGKDEQTTHWHSLYSQFVVNNKRRTMKGRENRIVVHKLPYDRHLEGFPLIARDAAKLGVEIINASPDSKIKEFPKVRVKDLL